MIVPPADQITPEPLPRAPGQTRTVERRSCSAISPNPVTGMSFASARAFADNDVHLLRCAAADELERERFADGFAVKLRVDVFEARNRMAGECDENVSDDDAGFVRGTFGLDFENHGGGFFAALQGLAERVRQTHGLQADAEIALRNVAFFQQRVDDAIDRGGRNGYDAEADEPGCGDADDAALRVHYGSADGGGLQRDVDTDVWRESRAGPRAALGRDQADDPQGGDGAAGARSAYDEREIAGFESGDIAQGEHVGRCFWAFQDGKI